MDKERIKGMAEQGKGSVKETAGKALGDEKLKAEGKMDRMEGKIRNVVGGVKDEIRESSKEQPSKH